MKIQLIICLCILFNLSFAINPHEKINPKIVKEKKGKTTNMKIVGARKALYDIGCIDMSKAKNVYNPVDYMDAAFKCISQDKYDKAIRLLIIANAYSDFDAQRVTDKSAKEAGYIVYMEFGSKVSAKYPNATTKLNEARKDLLKNPSALKKYCNTVKKIGYPTYYPNYMILHGMKGFSGDPHKDALLKDFDAKAAWQDTLKVVLKCP